jgi:hypothetical protein
MKTTTERESDSGIGSSKLLSGVRPHLPAPHSICAGKFRLTNFRPGKVGEPGKYWLDSADGEGLETSEDKIEAMLADFFRRQF